MEMQENKIKSYGFLIMLILITIMVALIGSLMMVRQEKNNNTMTTYVDAVCQENAYLINGEMEQMQGIVNVMYEEIMDTVSTSGDFASNKDKQDKVVADMGAMFYNVMSQFDFIQTAFLRYSPEIAGSSAGVMYNRTDFGPTKTTVTPLDKYSEDDIAHVGWYYLPISYVEGMWMEPYVDETLGIECISYVIPIFYKGKTLGVVGMDLNMVNLFRMVKEISVLDGYAYLLNLNDQIIGNDVTIADSSCYESRVRLTNGMKLCVAVNKESLYPIRNSTEYNVYMVVLLFIMIVLVAYLIVAFSSFKFNSKDKVERGSKLQVGFAMGMMLIVVAQAVAVLIGGSLSIQAANNSIEPKNKGDRPVLRVVGDAYFAPYSFLDDNGKPIGSDVEIIYAIADQMNMNVEVQLMPESEATQAMADSRADLMLGLDNLDDYDSSRMVMSRNISDDTYVIYGKKPVDSIATVRNSKVAATYGMDQIDVYGLCQDAVKYNTYAEVMSALVDGSVDYAIVRKNVGDYHIASKGYVGIMQVYDIMDSRLFLGIGRSIWDKQDAINNAIAKLDNSGKINQIQQRWYTDSRNQHPYSSFIMEYMGFFQISAIICGIFFLGFVFTEVRNRYVVLRIDSDTDTLTGIYNRRGGESRIRKLITADRQGIFCLIDVDSFKYINDTFGHEVGDIVLKQIANTLMRHFRDVDVVMRLGGDEFVVFVSEVQESEAAGRIFDRLFATIDGMDIPELYGHRVSISLGATFVQAGCNDTFDGAYSRADSGTYISKKVEGCAYTII